MQQKIDPRDEEDASSLHEKIFTDCQTVNLSHPITGFYNLELMGSKLHMAILEQKLVEQANGVVQNQFPSAVPIS